MIKLFHEGSSVQLDNIGIFSPTLASKPEATAEEVNESSISGMRIQFRADKWMKRQMKDCSFKKVKS